MTYFFDDFLMRALLAGIIIAMISGIMGCFVVWRKMAYFGDSISHSSLLGIAMGVFLGWNINISIIILSSIFAVLLLWAQHKKILASDTLLGIFAHSALSLALIIISLLQLRINLHSYLFGDILSISQTDLIWIAAVGLIVVVLLRQFWSSLVLMTLHEDLAKAEGVNTFFMKLLFTLLMTLLVAISIRIVGVLLITSMLIIPAAAARQLSKTPEMMALYASIIGALSVIGGLYISMQWDTPSGPSIIITASSIFIVLFSVTNIARR